MTSDQRGGGTPPGRQLANVVRRRAGRPRSRRLTFAYDEQGVRLVSHADRMKPAPPSDHLDAEPGRATIVAELRSRDDALVYRRTIPEAIPRGVEVFSPDGSIRRVDRALPSGSFSVVVPLERRAGSVVLVAGPGVPIERLGARPDDARAGRRTILGRFPLVADDAGGAR